MNTFQSVILIALLGNMIIGFMVWVSNPRRSLNRYFLLTTGLIALWLICMFANTITDSATWLTFWTRQVSAAAAFLPIGFFILRCVIVEPELKFFQVFCRIKHLLLFALLITVLCQTNFFMRDAYYANIMETVPAGHYGHGFFVYIAYFVAMVAGMVVSIRHTFLNSSGVRRAESQFLLLGWLLSFSFGLILFTSAILIGKQEMTRFLPLFAFIMDGFVAYGIATRRILSVSVVLQRLTAYILMTIYLVILYVITVWLIDSLFDVVIEETSNLSHLLAALVVAFSVIPAQGLMKNVSSRLFLSAKSFDMDQVLEETRHMFQEVTSEDKLMAEFSNLIIQTFKTTRVILLRMERDGTYRQHYVFPEQESSVALKPNSGLIKLLKRDHQPFTTDTLERMRPSAPVKGARQKLKAFGAAAAAGSFAHNKLAAVILVFPKITGAIFDAHEQRALQLLCDQLAVALENASLYTEVQNSKIYNEILLDSMGNGLVAVNEDRVVTVFNQRAQAITGLNEDRVVNHTLAELPDAMAAAIELILKTGDGFRDRDMVITSGEEQIPVRVSGSGFQGHTGETVGALLVFTDMTLLRKMEEQIRRTDRLSSIGTLSAGMAHEIKNPLVTIKTFTDLLPRQYGDEEFRHTFFDLVGQEVERIDEIVNRLLNFARPAKASLKPVFLHDVLNNSLRLVEQQMTKQKISSEKNLEARQHLVMADSEQLNQIFVNLFLNAIHAMEPDGTLSVSTVQLESAIRVDVRDTGCGMTAEQRKHIFDPFFTTKEHGVGLGLSVTHGIIQEHKGTVDVESVEGKGTVFHVELPLMESKEIVNG